MVFSLSIYTQSIIFTHKNTRQRGSSHLSSAGQRNRSPLRTFCLSWASHSLAHSRHRGHRTALAQSFFLSPGAVHSPTAEVGVQKIFPDQRHLSTLLSESYSTYKACGFVVCIISSYTHIVNRFYPISFRKVLKSHSFAKNAKRLHFGLAFHPECVYTLSCA